MSVKIVNTLSRYFLTPLSFMYQWLYKIVYMSIYRVYLKSNNGKKIIRKLEREYRKTLTVDKFAISLTGQGLQLSKPILTIH